MLVLASPLFARTPARPFVHGDTVCFLGDSITHSGHWHRYIELFYTCRFPERRINMVNCGITGDRALGALKRLDWDVLIHQPTVIVIMLGMNDIDNGSYDIPHPSNQVLADREVAIRTYRTNMAALVEAIKKRSSARIILVKPSPYDETARLSKPGQRGPNAALAKCADICGDLAVKYQTELVDFHGPMTRLMLEGQKIDPKFALCGPDRVHPGAAGHLMMAALFLQAQGLAAPLMDVNVEGTNSMVTVRPPVQYSVRKDAETTSIQMKSSGLPLVTGVSDPVLARLTPIDSLLSGMQFRVQNAAMGSYRLKIGEVDLGAFTHEQLNEGLNLGVIPQAPDVKQAQQVSALAAERYALSQPLRDLARIEAAMRNANVSPDNDAAAKQWLTGQGAKFVPRTTGKPQEGAAATYAHMRAGVAETRRKRQELLDQMRQLAVTKPHTWTLEKLPE